MAKTKMMGRSLFAGLIDSFPAWSLTCFESTFFQSLDSMGSEGIVPLTIVIVLSVVLYCSIDYTIM